MATYQEKTVNTINRILEIQCFCSFLPAFHLSTPRLSQFEAVSMSAGAMMLRVDILTAPRRDTNKSSQGTVAARATKTKIETGSKIVYFKECLTNAQV